MEVSGIIDTDTGLMPLLSPGLRLARAHHDTGLVLVLRTPVQDLATPDINQHPLHAAHSGLAIGTIAKAPMANRWSHYYITW